MTGAALHHSRNVAPLRKDSLKQHGFEALNHRQRISAALDQLFLDLRRSKAIQIHGLIVGKGKTYVANVAVSTLGPNLRDYLLSILGLTLFLCPND